MINVFLIKYLLIILKLKVLNIVLLLLVKFVKNYYDSLVVYSEFFCVKNYI